MKAENKLYHYSAEVTRVVDGDTVDAFVDLGWVPNWQMAAILRDMDVGLFPNRCEGGTNLVAMEAMVLSSRNQIVASVPSSNDSTSFEVG